MTRNRDARMLPTSRGLGPLIAAVAVFMLLIVVMPSSSSAQTSTTIEVGTPVHSADGTIVTSLVANAEAIASLAVLIDGQAVPFTVDQDAPESASRTVFVVENSISMTTAQLADVRGRINELAAALGPADEVGIVTFGGGASVALPLTADREALDAAASAMRIEGSSALYSGVTTATEVLADDGRPALIVLITYGWDWGGVSTHSRAESLDAVAATTATVYVQSMVFDNSVDTAYLAPLATDGLVRGINQLAALPDAAALLGTPTSSQTLIITAPPLARGDHELRVSTQAGAEHVTTFPVTNEGLLTVEIAEPTVASDPIGVRITSAVGLTGLDLTASLAGSSLNVAADGTIAVDPWTVESGSQSMKLTATVDGQTAVELTTTITIPALSPVLTVETTDASLTATVRAQPGGAAGLVALVAGEVVAETTTGTLEIDRPTNAGVTFELRATDGTVVATEQFSAATDSPTTSTGGSETAGGSPIWTSPPFLAIPLAFAALLVALVLKRRGPFRRSHDDHEETSPVTFEDVPVEDVDSDDIDAVDIEPLQLPTFTDVAQPAESAASEPWPAEPVEPSLPEPAEPEPAPAAPLPEPIPIRAPEWAVVIRPLNGETRRVDVGYEPVSIGASKLCTVTLDGDTVRFVHLVIARQGRGLTAHQFGPVTVNGKERDVENAELLTEAVMQIGDVSVWLEKAVEEAPAAEA